MHRYLAALFCIILLASCRKDEPAPPAATERTLLVYMVANNNLGRPGYDVDDNGFSFWRRAADSVNIEQMQYAARMGHLGNGRLLVYHNDNASKNTLYEVLKDGTLKVLRSYPADTPSTSSQRMTRVIDDTRTLAPAADYGLVLWSHGDGWLENGIEPSQPSRPGVTYSFGADGYRRMNVSTLAQVLQPYAFSFVYFDCCYMASVEVAYQMRHCTPYIAGSATELPWDGMPYGSNIKALMEGSAPESVVNAATNTFSHYNALSGSARTCTMSVIATAGMDSLAAATRRIYAKAAAPVPAGYRPQYLNLAGSLYYDMEHFVKAMATADDDYAAWRKALESCVIYSAATPKLWNRLTLDSHCGLSTFIGTPDGTGGYRPYSYGNYSTLEWYRDVACALDRKD